MKKLLVLLVPSTLSSAGAAFTPTQLAQLVKSPDKFKPISKSTDSEINAGTPVYIYSWPSAKGITPDVELQRLPQNAAAWELALSGSLYKLSKIAPQRKLLATVNDQVMNEELSIYAITGGPLKGSYALESKYSDGSGSVKVQTKAFALAAAKGSEFKQDTSTKLLSYPLYGLLGARGMMCGLPEVSCK